MIIRRTAKPTLTAVELQHEDSLVFTLRDGQEQTITIKDTGAHIVSTTLAEPGIPEDTAQTVYAFWCEMEIEGQPVRMEREVGSQKSFYEPEKIAGMTIWLDAVDAIFDFMQETHGACRPTANCHHSKVPRKQVRLALQDSTLRICPDTIKPWCPLPQGGLKIEECYRGEDCWMGPYDGASAHGGLDINHPKGTPLSAPIELDDQFLHNSVADGANNNRWTGIRRWADGSTWILQSAHMVKLTVPEHTPLKAGQQYAVGAGVWVGVHEHSHFIFRVFDRGEYTLLDPWILFRQMYRDRTQ